MVTKRILISPRGFGVKKLWISNNKDLVIVNLFGLCVMIAKEPKIDLRKWN